MFVLLRRFDTECHTMNEDTRIRCFTPTGSKLKATHSMWSTHMRKHQLLVCQSILTSTP